MAKLLKTENQINELILVFYFKIIVLITCGFYKRYEHSENYSRCKAFEIIRTSNISPKQISHILHYF